MSEKEALMAAARITVHANKLLYSHLDRALASFAKALKAADQIAAALEIAEEMLFSHEELAPLQAALADLRKLDLERAVLMLIAPHQPARRAVGDEPPVARPLLTCTEPETVQ